MNDRGFSLIEVIIAIVVLTVGILAMAGTTSLVVRQVTIAEATSDRAAVLQTTIERLRGIDFDLVADGTATEGPFTVDWTVTGTSPVLTVEVVTTGPGVETVPGAGPRLSNTVADTFRYMVVHP